MSIYSYFQKYFITHFCLSLNNQNGRLNQYKVPQLRKLIVKFTALLRKKNKNNFLRYSFLLVLIMLCSLDVRSFPRNKYTFSQIAIKQNLYTFYEKFIILIYSHLTRKAVILPNSVNDYFQATFTNLASPEFFFFDLHLYEQMFQGFFSFHFFFSPLCQLDCFAQRNYIRMLNFPLQVKNSN